ncbi:MAG TPA: bifunctional oligoribonuclease/PAP phosphatase NrnA [Bacteroidia bacterium]|nr:bifunctional oligoribonuclease/PAP phosphatase NrnA [Bacteroidia bacterium]
MQDPEIESIKKLLSEKKKIVITTHYNPDGDAMGSSLGLYHYLKSKKHIVNIITPNVWPSFLNWMPGSDNCIAGDLHLKKAARLLEEAEIIFSLDYNALKRTNDLADLIGASSGIKIMIDHHQQPENFATYTYSDVAASSTCEMVYEFIKAIDDTVQISKDCAECLYTGIMTDTGSFKFSSTTSKTHLIVADLIAHGARNTYIHQQLFDNNTYERMRLLGYCLSEKLTLLNEYHAAFIALTSQDLEHFHYKKGDTEGIVNYALSISDINFSAIFIERDDEIKISFRSKGNFDVNTFARNHFEGGGHPNAAGGKGANTMDETIMKFVQLLPQYKQALLIHE